MVENFRDCILKQYQRYNVLQHEIHYKTLKLNAFLQQNLLSIFIHDNEEVTV